MAGHLIAGVGVPLVDGPVVNVRRIPGLVATVLVVILLCTVIVIVIIIIYMHSVVRNCHSTGSLLRLKGGRHGPFLWFFSRFRFDDRANVLKKWMDANLQLATVSAG